MSWTIVRNEEALQQALKLAKGSYQTDLLLGRESLSGSTLRGAVKNFGGKYAASRHNLLDRMQAAGIPFHEETGENNRRLLVIG